MADSGSATYSPTRDIEVIAISVYYEELASEPTDALGYRDETIAAPPPNGSDQYSTINITIDSGAEIEDRERAAIQLLNASDDEIEYQTISNSLPRLFPAGSEIGGTMLVTLPSSETIAKIVVYFTNETSITIVL